MQETWQQLARRQWPGLFIDGDGPIAVLSQWPHGSDVCLMASHARAESAVAWLEAHCGHKDGKFAVIDLEVKTDA